MLALTTFVVSGCAGGPKMPDIEVGLVDAKNQKHHIYQVPKQQGQNAPHLRSEALTLNGLNKNYTLRPSQYSIFEKYLSEVEDWAKEHCK